jgi:hypothetical protein
MNPYDIDTQELQHAGFVRCEQMVREAVGLPDGTPLWGRGNALERMYDLEEEVELEAEDRRECEKVLDEALALARKLSGVLEKKC